MDENAKANIRDARARKEAEKARHLSLLAVILIASGKDKKLAAQMAVEAYDSALGYIVKRRRPIRGVDDD